MPKQLPPNPAVQEYARMLGLDLNRVTSQGFRVEAIGHDGNTGEPLYEVQYNVTVEMPNGAIVGTKQVTIQTKVAPPAQLGVDREAPAPFSLEGRPPGYRVKATLRGTDERIEFVRAAGGWKALGGSWRGYTYHPVALVDPEPVDETDPYGLRNPEVGE